MNGPLTPHDLGRSGEEFALDYLKRKGYRIIERGFRFARGEIDIIAGDADTLVFVEVKTRRGRRSGDPEDAVTERKRRQIRRIAQGYLLQRRLEDIKCRFDVLALTKDEARRFKVTHYIDAFE